MAKSTLEEFADWDASFKDYLRRECGADRLSLDAKVVEGSAFYVVKMSKPFPRYIIAVIGDDEHKKQTLTLIDASHLMEMVGSTVRIADERGDLDLLRGDGFSVYAEEDGPGTVQ